MNVTVKGIHFLFADATFLLQLRLKYVVPMGTMNADFDEETKGAEQ
jgi:hypothetical protein